MSTKKRNLELETEKKQKSTKRVSHHKTTWTNSYEKLYALVPVDWEKIENEIHIVSAAQCRLCMSFGREHKHKQGHNNQSGTRGKRRTIQVFKSFRVDHIKKHMTREHPRKWYEYQAIRDNARSDDEIEFFFKQQSVDEQYNQGIINSPIKISSQRSFSNSDTKVKYLIIGAGPTGLGGATRLLQHGEVEWLLLESSSSAGGLSSTVKTKQDFLFDLGGHVIFSHYQFFDQLLDHAVGQRVTSWSIHDRESYVWIRNRYIPYPFQHHINQLPNEDKLNCLQGLVNAKVETARNIQPPDNFDEWMMRSYGEGITELFMRPYNFKVWAYPATEMQYSWLGERVATVNVDKVIQNLVEENETNSKWGPNSTFRYPQEGGTGSIWKNVASLLPSRNIRYNSYVIGIDPIEKHVKLADGSIIGYESLLSTMPLDQLLDMMGRNDLASEFRYTSTYVIGIGIRGIHKHGSKCWMYYPEANCPFYRATIFSTYAAGNCPPATKKLPTIQLAGDKSRTAHLNYANEMKGGPYWSLLFEVSESEYKEVNSNIIVENVIQGAINVQLLSYDDEIVSIYCQRLERGYPTPFLNRDKILDEALSFCHSHNIWSRGRFGGYKYEVSNQDHSLMQGVEAIDNMMFGTHETTLQCPSVVNRKNGAIISNSRKFTSRAVEII